MTGAHLAESAAPSGVGGGRLPAQLMRAIRRDPLHFPEQLVLIAQARLAAPSLEWAAEARRRRSDATTGELAERTRTDAARFGRTNGALAGTPFLLALVPAYVSVLWEQARMVMRIAALNGRDPREPAFVAELLSLRGLYETPQAAGVALAHVGASPAAEVQGIRARLAVWAQLGFRVLILAGFLSGPEPGAAKRSRPVTARAIRIVTAAVIFVITWVFPLTFMVAMSWSCENDTRTLGERAILYYGEEPLRRGHGLRPADRRAAEPARGIRISLRAALLVMSLAVPLGLVAIAIARPVGHAHLVAISGFIGLTVVLALSARAAKR